MFKGNSSKGEIPSGSKGKLPSFLDRFSRAPKTAEQQDDEAQLKEAAKEVLEALKKRPSDELDVTKAVEELAKEGSRASIGSLRTILMARQMGYEELHPLKGHFGTIETASAQLTSTGLTKGSKK